MAGFYKIYMVGGSGGFLGADGINPIAFQILIGTSSREWLEPNYFDKEFNSISGITHMIPKGPINDDNIIDGLIIFAPQLFEESCDLLKDAHMHFDKLGKKRIDMSEDQPAFWNDLVSQAKSRFDNLKLYRANIEDLRPESF